MSENVVDGVVAPFCEEDFAGFLLVRVGTTGAPLRFCEEFLLVLWSFFRGAVPKLGRIYLRWFYIVFKSTLVVCMVGMRAALFVACPSALKFCGHGYCRGCIGILVSAIFVA